MFTLFRKSRKVRSFEDIPVKKRRRILKAAIKAAHKEQRELVKQFDKKFGKEHASSEAR